MAGYNTTQNQKIASRAVISALMLWLAFCGMAAAEQLYVNESGWWRDGGAFNVSDVPIQAAVGAAGEGDAIYVWNGSYIENVNVYKQLTLEGEGTDVVTVTAADPGDHVFEVTADYVNISGFAVRGATDNDMVGIRLTNADYCNISENDVYGNDYGIYLYYSSNNNLTNNNANSNSDHGIYLYYSSNNNLRNNNANSNNGYGIWLSSSSDNTLTNNTANKNRYSGIHLSSSSNNTLTNNNASNNRYSNGIYLYYSSNNNLTNNNASNNRYSSGIYLYYSSNNNLTNNNANSNNDYGIYLRSLSNNELTGNTANSNNDYGIYLDNADNSNINCNLVQNNTWWGFYLTGGSTGNNISYNNIIENGNYNTTSGGWEWQFRISQYQPVEAKHNYWGAGMNNSTIDASIYDDEEDGWGEVAFYPFETEPVPCAPTPEEPYIFTTADAVIALQIAAGSRPSDLCYDVSGDGSVTSLDALMILQAAAGNPEDPITGCGDLDQRILRMYDQDKDGKIDADWMEAASIDLDLNRITQSEYDQVKYAYEHNCPVEAADAPSNTR